MRMIPIYNNVGRLLGHIDAKTFIESHHDVTVNEDISLEPYSPSAICSETANICRIPKRHILFRNALDECSHTFLVTTCALPDWFWKNLGCVEFKPDHFKRIPWQ